MKLTNRCCLPCKGTNFLANHNERASVSCRQIDVVYLAKVRIFQQITTIRGIRNIKKQMLFTLQRYEFFSKSQLCCTCCPFLPDVVYLAKVRIFQQITTTTAIIFVVSPMLFTLQRYEFFSKSQLLIAISSLLHRCCLPCKGTNFLANHNNKVLFPCVDTDVVYLAKVRIFQQITTFFYK